MKIGELRETIKTHNKKELEYLVAELYKLVPNHKIQDYGVDTWIQKPITKNKAKQKKVIKARDIIDIAIEVATFENNAKNQNYLFPNNQIPKKERPKWRYIVKRLYKEILVGVSKGDNKFVSAIELTKLYKLLTYACDWQIFSTYDPFVSVGITQIDFFEQITKLNRESLEINDFIENSVDLIINNPLNRYTLYSNLINVFFEYQNTTYTYELIIEYINELRPKVIIEVDEKKSWSFSTDEGMSYSKKEKLNNLTYISFTARMQLSNYDNAINYFYDNYLEPDKEVILYILIDLLFNYNLPEIILRELNKNSHLPLRDNLKNLQNHIRKAGKLPDRFP